MRPDQEANDTANNSFFNESDKSFFLLEFPQQELGTVLVAHY